MTRLIFRDDDRGYERWLASHRSGWVVNARRNPTRSYLKLHRAACHTVSRLQSGYSTFTAGQYSKVCADDRAELEAWAREEFSCTLQDGCSCLRLGESTTASQSTHELPKKALRDQSSAPPTAQLDAEGFLSLEAGDVISYSTTNENLLAAKEGLGRALGTLTAKPGEILHGVIEGRAAQSTDLDNTLLYNIGGSVAAATKYGVLLERRPEVPDAVARYRYRLTCDPGCGEANVGDPIAHLRAIRLSRQPLTWQDVWRDVRRSEQLVVERTLASGEVVLFISIGAPRFRGAANGTFVKTFVDGVLVALHYEPDARAVVDVAGRMAARVSLPEGEVARLLCDDTKAALGPVHGLVCLRGEGVQCWPEDGRIAALRLEVDRSAPAWSVTGWVAERRP